MALLTAMSLTEARRVARSFGLDIAHVEALSAGSVNSNFRLAARDGTHWFARVYEEQGTEGAAAELALVRELAAHGVPTPVPLAELAEHAGRPLAIYPWVDGEILCQARVTPGACSKVGQALASVHLSGVESPGEGRFRVADIESRLRAIGTDVPEASGMLERLIEYGGKRDAALPRGLIHGDLFRDNVLWHAGEVAALIDFESASRGAFAYDLMVTLLAWCCGDRLEPALMRALVDGYRSRRELEPREWDALRVEGAIACLRFATTRITDFAMRAPAGEPPKRDYRRFLQRLDELERGALDALRA